MLILLFLIAWIVFNGQLTLEIVLFGIGIGIAMDLFVYKFMSYQSRYNLAVLKLLLPGVEYILILLWEIIKANFSTAKFILSSKIDCEPVLVDFDVPLKSNFARVILANSITLTPGTITVSLEDTHYTVHCLDKDLAVGLDDSVFVKKLTAMEDLFFGSKKVSK